jgi:hypothetical protein
MGVDPSVKRVTCDSVSRRTETITCGGDHGLRDPVSPGPSLGSVAAMISVMVDMSPDKPPDPDSKMAAPGPVVTEVLSTGYGPGLGNDDVHRVGVGERIGERSGLFLAPRKRGSAPQES